MAKDHTQRVCRLFFETEETPKRVHKLWDNRKINILWNNFFWRNNNLYAIDTLNNNDIRLINSDTWPKPFSDAANVRKAEIRKRDVEDFQSFTESRKAKEITKLFEIVAADLTTSLDVREFFTMLDYLLLRLIMASDNDLTQTLRPKTLSGGPEKLMWDRELKGYADTYVSKLAQYMLTTMQWHWQRRESQKRWLFFISTKGNPLNESRASHRLAEMGKKVAPDLKGTLKSSRLRKSIVSLQCEEAHTISEKQLALESRWDTL